MSGADWDPTQYERFRSERSRPFWDLLALVEPVPAGAAVDLGCGTGELTRALHERLGASTTVGVDNSDAMLEKAAEHTGGGLSFAKGDIAVDPRQGPFDVIFSNAALHWVPDFEGTLARLAALLRPGGQLAVQIPQNFDHPSHSVAAAMAREAPFAASLAGYESTGTMHPPEKVAAWLDRLGFREQRVRLEVYGHPLAHRRDVVEWVKGTTLVPYRQRLGAAAYEAFLREYEERLVATIGDTDPYFYAFKRLLLWARR
jgi:trans-aconitate 2-methyltransferase